MVDCFTIVKLDYLLAYCLLLILLFVFEISFGAFGFGLDWIVGFCFALGCLRAVLCGFSLLDCFMVWFRCWVLVYFRLRVGFLISWFLALF